MQAFYRSNLYKQLGFSFHYFLTSGFLFQRRTLRHHEEER